MIEHHSDTTQRLGHKFGLAPIRHEMIARADAQKFVRTDAGSFNSKFYDFFLHRRTAPEIAIVELKTHSGTLGMPERVAPFRKYSNFVVVEPIVTLGAPGQLVTFTEPGLTEPKIEVFSDAQERLSGHTVLAEKVYSVIKEEAKRSDVLPSIVVRPSWSHEYEDLTGIVIDVEIHGDDDKRFTLWDAISSKLDALLDSMSAEEQAFLMDNLSVVVNKSG
jgi:hypothetical protein